MKTTNHNSSNIFANLPEKLPDEVFEDIVKTENIRIERILSYGQSSPTEGWYHQENNEWVMVLKGYGIIEFEDGSEVKLQKGDYINIKAHQKHKVKETSSKEITIWLAIFY